MFKAVFLYAVLRGILDFLTRRPELQIRLAYAALSRARAEQRAATRELKLAITELSKAMLCYGSEMEAARRSRYWGPR